MTDTETPQRTPLGRVVTFYSYKGGTGRSMALANAAWTIAANGMRVLVIDWDLEAPGLHRYFRPYLRDPSLEASDGLMDFVLAFADAARAPAEAGVAEPAWYEAHADLRLYAYAVAGPGLDERGGRLDFVPAGRQDPGYTLRVNSFNWQHFYSKLGGGIFLEAVKRRLREEYDYILIDSRTGVSDTSGVCTVQMPDILVVCFTLNEQSIQGASATAASALEQRRVYGGASTLRVLPVPTRVDVSEKERVDAARAAAREHFDRFLGWLDEDQLDEYWADVEMPYIAFYSLEEVLAVFDQPRVRTSLLPSIEGLVGWISEQRITALPPLDETRRREELARFIRPTKRAPTAKGRALYVSYAHRDGDEYLTKFVEDLSVEVGALTGLPNDEVAFFDRQDMKLGDALDERIEAAVDTCSVMLCLVSPAYVNSEWARREYAHTSVQGKEVFALLWVPLEGPMPEPLARAKLLPAGESGGGMRYLVRRHTPAYRDALDDLARSIAISINGRRKQSGTAPPAEEAASAVMVPIVAERFRVMQKVLTDARQYGLRRRDWAPFGKSMGDAVLEAASKTGVPVRLVSLHHFRRFLKQRVDGMALVIVDSLTAQRPEYDKQLTEWDSTFVGQAGAIVCVPLAEAAVIAQRYKELAQSSRPISIVTNEDELSLALVDALVRLQKRYDAT